MGIVFVYPRWAEMSGDNVCLPEVLCLKAEMNGG